MKIRTRTRYRIVGSDYSAQEPRITTFLSRDPNMLRAYHEGKDLYCVIAQAIFHNSYEDNLEFYPEGTKLNIDGGEVVCGVKTHINPEGKHRRKIAKVVLLALTYGMGVNTLAQRLDCSRDEAQVILDSFFQMFPKVRDLMDSSQKSARAVGYVEDWAGRRRHLPDISLEPYEFKAETEFNPLLECRDRENPAVEKWKRELKGAIDEFNSYRRSRDPKAENTVELPRKTFEKIASEARKDGVEIQANSVRIAQAERQCLNARIQGGAASLTKLSMVNIYRDRILNECMTRMLISVHDEVLVECPVLYADRVSKRLPEVMIETAGKYIDVPMSCDPYCVSNWYADTYSNAVQDEYEKLCEKDRDTALKKVEDNHPELPKQVVDDCVLKGKEINLEEFDD